MPRAKKKMETTGGEYGQQAQLSRDQDVVPAGPAVTDRPAAPAITPDMVPNLSAPTQRPDEPLMAGMPTGPGKNWTTGPPNTQTLNTLRALYARNPTVHLRRLIERAGG